MPADSTDDWMCPLLCMQLDFYDIISEEDRLAMYVNLKIKAFPLYIWVSAFENPEGLSSQ